MFIVFLLSVLVVWALRGFSTTKLHFVVFSSCQSDFEDEVCVSLVFYQALNVPVCCVLGVVVGSVPSVRIAELVLCSGGSVFSLLTR